MFHEKKVKEAVSKRLLWIGKQGQLSPLETIVGMVLVYEEWTLAKMSLHVHNFFLFGRFSSIYKVE